MGRFELHTPMMVTGVRGTRYRVAADVSGSRSEVLEGRVGVGLARAAAGPATAVTAGYGIGTSAGGSLSRPVALLPAPQLQPLPDTVLGPVADAAWQPVQGAAGYRVRSRGMPRILNWSGPAKPRRRISAWTACPKVRCSWP
ncbi:FecR domain-containing protein [Cupriavidus basilensis]